MNDKDIIRWASKVQPLAIASTTASAPYPNPALKNQHQLPSPRKRHQTITDESNPTSKRQRTDENVIKVDEKPEARSSRGRREYIPAPTGSQSEQSHASGRSSPLKKLLAMEVFSEGFEIRSLSLLNPNLPPALSQLLRELMWCSNGFGFISNDLQAEIKEQSKQDPSLPIFGDNMFASPGVRDQLGTTPSLNDAAFITKEAQECQDNMQSKAGWNMIVHYPLLHKAIYGQRRHKQKQLVGFTPCTTANIIQEYLPIRSQAEMVDFCIYIEPKMDDIAFNAILSLRQVLPCYVINHTDFPPLRSSPIAVSILAWGQRGAQPATMELQLGTWHAGQWNLLEDLVARSGGTFDGLSFLPAVIVEGHYWSFAATTRKGRKTVLWLEQRFGSTSDVVGVYKTIWGLQRLAKWAREVYWPWFRKNALGVSEVKDDA
ncbi:hypothetical protein BJX63DRAFT_437719 [Aspergillus granulosus]|uniref:PD-(D/E)XK nuclease-like domain-containing protein n=1 Tax=Aspergillus granulosus TaxID=176169 RepID=A0ABR4GU84_9EURO